jgi:hypothetical protein
MQEVSALALPDLWALVPVLVLLGSLRALVPRWVPVVSVLPGPSQLSASIQASACHLSSDI